MCNNPFCKFIDIVEIRADVKLFIHYTSEGEPLSIMYDDADKLFKKKFYPKDTFNFVELGKFQISLNDIKNEDFDLTDIIELD
jgi:hypothetical protein